MLCQIKSQDVTAKTNLGRLSLTSANRVNLWFVHMVGPERNALCRPETDRVWNRQRQKYGCRALATAADPTSQHQFPMCDV